MAIYEQYVQHMDKIYSEFAILMKECVQGLSSDDKKEKVEAAKRLGSCLACLNTMHGLDELTAIYRNKPEDNVFGYNVSAVMMFVEKMSTRYLKDMDHVKNFLFAMKGFEKVAKMDGLMTEASKLEEAMDMIDSMLTTLDDRLENENAKDSEIRESIIASREDVVRKRMQMESVLNGVRDQMHKLINEAELITNNI